MVKVSPGQYLQYFNVCSQCVEYPTSCCNVRFHKALRSRSPTSFNFPFRIVRRMMTDRMTGIHNPPAYQGGQPITRQDLYQFIELCLSPK